MNFTALEGKPWSTDWTCLDLVRDLIPSSRSSERRGPKRWNTILRMERTVVPQPGDIILWANSVWDSIQQQQGWVEWDISGSGGHAAIFVTEDGLLFDCGLKPAGTWRFSLEHDQGYARIYRP